MIKYAYVEFDATGSRKSWNTFESDHGIGTYKVLEDMRSDLYQYEPATPVPSGPTTYLLGEYEVGPPATHGSVKIRDLRLVTVAPLPPQPRHSIEYGI